MPGITGLITKKPRAWAEAELKRMVGALAHEPFYRLGMWVDEALGVYVGWAARENSFADAMPLRNEDSEVVLIFSGEDYPEPGTARRLKERGHQLAEAEAAYLVHLYEDDPSFPRSLNGRFHGLLADRAKGRTVLFNDRFGMHRLYYHEANGAFYFSAEAKSILGVRPELRSTDVKSLGEFVTCGCVFEDRTLFTGIHLLPHGSAWVFRNGALEARNIYFHPREWEQQESLDAETYYQEVQQAFFRNLPRYFAGQNRVGMSLTGGLDTRMIMAWHKAAPGELPCYTFGGSYRECRDVTVARQVAEICRQSYEIIPTGKEFLDNFPRYAERSVYLTDGGVDLSRTPALYVNEKARAIAPVRMAGIYGSEILRRLRAFKPWQPAPGIFGGDLLPYLDEAKISYAGLLPLHPVSFVVFQPAPQRGVDALESSQLEVRTPYLDNDLVRLAFRAPASGMVSGDAAANHDVCLRLIREGNPALGRILTDRGLGGSESPFNALAKQYLEFTFKAEYAYDYGMPQWVAKVDHAFSPLHLERLFLGRHKFYHFRVWYRDQLAAYVRDMLLDSRTLQRPYLNREGVVSMVNGHLGGGRNFTSEIHKVLTLELVQRTLLESLSTETLQEEAVTAVRQ